MGEMWRPETGESGSICWYSAYIGKRGGSTSDWTGAESPAPCRGDGDVLVGAGRLLIVFRGDEVGEPPDGGTMEDTGNSLDEERAELISPADLVVCSAERRADTAMECAWNCCLRDHSSNVTDDEPGEESVVFFPFSVPIQSEL